MKSINESLASLSTAVMPWSRLLNEGWVIVGANHYKLDKNIHLFVCMSHGRRCITAEGIVELDVFTELEQHAFSESDKTLSSTVMPWSRLLNEDWVIVGANHIHLDKKVHLYVSMTRKGRCITAHGMDEKKVFKELERKAFHG